MNIQKSIQMSLTCTIVFLAGMSNSKASLLELTHDPLFLSQSTPPAIAVTYDDSGSMQRAYVEGMTNTGTSATFADPEINRLYYNPAITYRPPIGPDGKEFPDSVMTAAPVDTFTGKLGKTVDLTQNYVPLRNINYRTDGGVRIQFTTAGHPDLGNIKYWNTWTNEYPSDDAIAEGEDGTPLDKNDGVPAFYYEKNSDGKYVIKTIPSDQYTNFANWYTYNNSRMKLGRTAISRAFSTFGGDFKIAWQQLNRNQTFPAMDRFEGTHRTNFYNNWLFKVPTSGGTPLRNAFVRTGDLFKKKESYNYLSGTSSDTKYLSCQQNFHIAISDGAWKQTLDQTGHGSVGYDETSRTPYLPGDSKAKPTPNVDELLGQEYGDYDGDGNQKVFKSAEDLKTLSDITFHYWANDLVPDLKNNVKRYGQDDTRLDGTSIEPEVGKDLWDYPEYVWNPKNDPAYWQHIVTYNIGFGLNASLVEDYIKKHINNETDATSSCPKHPFLTDPKEAVLAAIRNGDCSWPKIPKGNEKDEIVEKVDDVFHSSVNSRGDFFSATNPDELIAALSDVINNILERLSKGGSSAFTSAIVTADTKAFSPGFDSSDWTGNFIARKVSDISGFGDPIWDTACYLTGGYCDATGETVTKQTNRNVYTYNKSGNSVVSFSGSLTGESATILAENSKDIRDKFNVTAKDIVDYVKGDISNEVKNGGRLRNRGSLMADVVHSSPIVIRGPGESFDDSLWPADSELYDKRTYLDFKIANQDRKNISFIGSNGGMLHAVEVDGTNEGKEKWAFVPNTALRNIHRLIDPTYQHWSFVDNTPILGDAYFKSKWNSVLIGGMRYGGQAFYALDVTDSNATAPKVLWEFTDANDKDMGFSYGQATIVRVSSTDEWVALIPNGYNNSQNDYPDPTDPRNQIGDGSAVLYVVRLSDGQLLAKLDTDVGTPATPNGMATAVAVDSSQIAGGVDLGADYAYAGDVYGNLWRFDFRSSSYTDWESSIEKVFKPDTDLIRPITLKPRVMFLPTGDVNNDKDSVVMFATGKYIELPDRSTNIEDQYVVGIYDGIDIDRSDPDDAVSILDPDYVEQVLSESGRVRNLTNKQVDFNDSDLIGWKIKLITKGERINSPLELLGQQILLVASTIPKGEDPCESGGLGWIMAIDPLTGATPVIGEIFDVEVNALDIDGNPITVLVSGTGILVNDPPVGGISILESQGGGTASIIIEGSTDTTIIDLEKFSWRRRNWSNLLTE